MEDNRFLVMGHIERDNMPLRPLFGAIVEAWDDPAVIPAVVEAPTPNMDSRSFIDCMRSVVHGVVNAAKRHRHAFLSVRIAPLRIGFLLDRPVRSGKIDVAIIAIAGQMSPLRFHVEINPSVEFPQPFVDELQRTERQMRQEMPKFHPTDPANPVLAAEFGDSMARRACRALFDLQRADLERKYDALH